MQFYESLDLAPKLALDAEDLKRRFYERSRVWHPDRFTRATPSEQQQALDKTAVLNDAFRTLRDPVARAEYFLHESGLEISKEAPPELLEEVFELNMALEELRGGDASVRPQLEAADRKFRAAITEIDRALAALFTRYDSAPDGKMLGEIRGALNRRRYISNLVRDVGKELNDKELNVNPGN